MGLITRFFLQVFAGHFFGDIERGEYGEGLARLYAVTKGKKRWTAFFLGVLTAVAYQFKPSLVPGMLLLTTLAGHAGFVDAGRRVDAPEIPDGIREATQFVASSAAAMSYVFFGLKELIGRVPGCEVCTDVVYRMDFWAGAIGVAFSWFVSYVDPGRRVVRG